MSSLLSRIHCSYKYYSEIYYKNNYLTLTNISGTTSSFTINIPADITTSMASYISYSLDDGSTWIRTNNVDNQQVTITIPNILPREHVLLKGSIIRIALKTGTNNYTALAARISIDSSQYYSVSGNIMSLYYDDAFRGKIIFPVNTNTDDARLRCAGLFRESLTLRDAENLIMPVQKTCPTKAIANCGTYVMLFYGCTNLLYPPKDLYAKQISPIDYYRMFQNCSSMVSFPTISVNYIAPGNGSCFTYMFYGCINAEHNAPTDLKGLNMGYNSYKGMFYNCKKLPYIPNIHMTNAESSQVFNEMFYGCTSLTDLSDFEINNFTTSGKNASLCMSMFNGCTSLTKTPMFRRKVLASEEMRNAFYGCTNLTQINIAFDDVSASNCLTNWTYNVAAQGVINHYGTASLPANSVNGVPSGWTVQQH